MANIIGNIQCKLEKTFGKDCIQEVSYNWDVTPHRCDDKGDPTSWVVQSRVIFFVIQRNGEGFWPPNREVLGPDPISGEPMRAILTGHSMSFSGKYYGEFSFELASAP